MGLEIIEKQHTIDNFEEVVKQLHGVQYGIQGGRGRKVGHAGVGPSGVR